MRGDNSPIRELEQLFDRVSRQIEESSRRWEERERPGPLGGDDPAMAIDVIDRADEVVVTVDVPGFDRDEIDVRVTDHTLRIEADHETAREERDERYLRQERRRESMYRSVRLPDEVDVENASASMDNGVLTITLPKLAPEDARSINIE